MIPDLKSDDLRRIQKELTQERKIQAIKWYRAATGAGLAHAKKAVEQIEADLRFRSPERFSSQPQPKVPPLISGTLFLVILLVGILGARLLWASYQGDVAVERSYSVAMRSSLLVLCTLQLCVQSLMPRRKGWALLALAVLAILLGSVIYPAMVP